MHAHKFLLVVSMAGVMAVSVNLRADDTPGEAALRESLRKSGSGSGTQTMSPAAPVAQPRVSQPVAAPPMQSAPTGAFDAVPVADGDYDTLIKALRTQPVMTYTPAPEEDHSALINTLRTQPGTTSTPTMATEVSVPPPSASPKTPAASPGFAPLQSPALPISATKEQRLDALLVQYKADQLTPEQYHKQRAAILAGQ